jgi:hypothetical protein
MTCYTPGKIVTWSNKLRIHTLPAPQASPEMAYYSAICERLITDRVTESRCRVLTGLVETQWKSKRGQRDEKTVQCYK